ISYVNNRISRADRECQTSTINDSQLLLPGDNKRLSSTAQYQGG
ncbi:unnamed protein product, partial [Rotaria sordida]